MPDWRPPISTPQLHDGQLHVWQIGLNMEKDRWQSLIPLLADDELAKAQCFHFDKHRRRYVVGRAALRILLGQYLSHSPAHFAFAYNKQGKPRLAANNKGINFNLSHTGDMMIVGMVLDKEIGVDIEAVTRKTDYMAIAQRWFSTQECRALQALPESQRTEAFFRIWCRKEAYIKARGEGLSHTLQHFSVTTDKHKPRLIEHLDDDRETARWILFDLDLGDDYSAAVAVESSSWQIDRYRLEISPAIG